jgi:hypothetical protein
MLVHTVNVHFVQVHYVFIHIVLRLCTLKVITHPGNSGKTINSIQTPSQTGLPDGLFSNQKSQFG